jgi:hypothetical protein
MRQPRVQEFSQPERVIQSIARSTRAVVAMLILALLIWLPAGFAAAQQGDSGFTPVSDHAQVIAQGVVELPPEQAVWRTVRERASGSTEATFEARFLGFVFASSGPLLLVDAGTGEQTRLGTGEGALVREGEVQQRSSLANDAVTYLAIELVTSSTSSPAAGTVLETGEPFAAPSGQHDLDLLADTLAVGENLTIPDSSAENLFLVTEGTATLTAPDGETEVLLAGESATFTGVRTVSAAPDSDAPASFLVAIIGPEVLAPTLPPQSAELSPVPGATAVARSGAGQGSITLQVYACPSGMTAQKIDITACANIDEGFAVTVSGPALAQPLTLSDAETTAAGFRWGQLPPGEYEIAETELPAGATSYVLAARGTNGGRISIDTTQPDQSVRIYNFRP